MTMMIYCLHRSMSIAINRLKDILLIYLCIKYNNAIEQQKKHEQIIDKFTNYHIYIVTIDDKKVLKYIIKKFYCFSSIKIAQFEPKCLLIFACSLRGSLFHGG